MRMRFCAEQARPGPTAAAGSSPGRGARAGRCRSPRGVAASATNAHSSDAAGRDDERRQREAERLDGRVLGLDPAPGASTAARRGRRPRARPRTATAPTTSSRGLGPVRGASPTQRDHGEDAEDEDDLADEDDPPRQLGGGPAAQDRADRDAGARRRRRSRRRRPCGPGPRSCRRSGRPSRAAPARRRCPRGSTSRGPARATVGDTAVSAEPQRVDDEADHERPATADDVADLAAGEHEHRHHEAVQGDHGLDRGDRRVEVVDQLADRDVHHGLVEDHDELGAPPARPAAASCSSSPPVPVGSRARGYRRRARAIASSSVAASRSPAPGAPVHLGRCPYRPARRAEGCGPGRLGGVARTVMGRRSPSTREARRRTLAALEVDDDDALPVPTPRPVVGGGWPCGARRPAPAAVDGDARASSPRWLRSSPPRSRGRSSSGSRPARGARGARHRLTRGRRGRRRSLLADRTHATLRVAPR